MKIGIRYVVASPGGGAPGHGGRDAALCLWCRWVACGESEAIGFVSALIDHQGHWRHLRLPLRMSGGTLSLLV